MSKPERCPKCKGTNISCHLGWAECFDCYYEWPYKQTRRLMRRVFKKLVK